MQYYSFSVVLLPTLQLVFSQQIDKYTDENRPYEFGFNIDGYQHRKETKDEKGIIKGEYGFITADGYYRVTKYETDENGNFKIISMKNYYVGFPPENPTTLPPTIFSQNISPQKIRKPNTPLLNQISDQKSLQKNGKTNVINSITTNAKPLPLFVPKTPTTTSVQYKTTTQRPPSFQGLAGCSHCIIPTTKAPLKSDPQKYNVDYRIDLNPDEAISENPKGRHQSDRPNPLPEKSVDINKPNFKQKENNFGSFKNFSTNNDAKSTNRPIEFNNHNFPKDERNFNVNGLPLSFTNENNKNQQQQQQHAGDIFNSNNNTSPEKVRLQLSNEEPNTTNTISPGKSQIPPVNKLTEFKNNSVPNVALTPELDSKRKLNNGLDTRNKLLYTFNYTVDFHGHHEDGFRDGAKEGDYFAGNKDGVQRKVNYLANEFGYQPNITLSDLDENDKRKINEGKEKHTGLKGYEFKWFYRK